MVLRRLFETSPKPGKNDKIIIVTGPLIDDVKKTYTFLASQLSTLNLPPPQLVSLNTQHAHEALARLAGSLHQCRDREVIAELGGGMRAIGALVTTLLITLGFNATIHVFHETMGAEMTLPAPTLDFLRNIHRHREEARLLVALLENKDATSNELSHILGTKEKTVHNRLSRLRKRGLVQKRGRGTPQLTPWGRTLAQIIKQYNLYQD